MSSLFFAVFLSLGWFTAEHFPPWVSWHGEIWAFMAVMWSVACLLFSKDCKSGAVIVPKIGWLMLLLAVVVIVQTITGRIGFVGDAWVLLFYFALCLAAIGVGYNIGSLPTPPVDEKASGQSLIAQFAMLVLLGGLCSVALAFIQTLDVWEHASWIHRMPGPRRPGANLGQANQLATFLLFAIASLAYLYESRRLRVVTALPMAAILLLGLAVTESRTGALSLLLMAGWWLLKQRRLGFVLSRRAVALWVIFFACSFWFWPRCLNFILIGGLDDAGATQVNMQAGTRLLVWPQLWQAVLQRPWFGWGLGEVSEAHNAVLHAYAVSEPFTYAHNIVLDLAVGMGLPLTLLLVVVTSAWLWRRVRDTKDLLSWYCLTLALPFGVHSMLEFPFAYAYLLAPVMFLLGVLEARLAPSRVVRIPWWTATAAWALVSVAMGWSAVEYIAIEEDFRIARFEAFNVGKTPSNYERPHVVLLTQLDALLEGARLVPTPGMAPQRIELARKVAMRFPATATQNRYALSLALNDHSGEAIRQLRVMRAMHGEKNYALIKQGWINLANEKYPQLRQLQLP